MGFWNWISKAGRKLYDRIKEPITRSYHWLKDGMNSIRNVGSYIDQKLNDMHNIPLLGELAELVQASPIYQGLAGGFNEADRLLQLGGSIGRDIDKIAGGNRRRDIRVSPVSGGSIASGLIERSIPQRSALSGLDASSFAIA